MLGNIRIFLDLQIFYSIQFNDKFKEIIQTLCGIAGLAGLLTSPILLSGAGRVLPGPNIVIASVWYRHQTQAITRSCGHKHPRPGLDCLLPDFHQGIGSSALLRSVEKKLYYYTHHYQLYVELACAMIKVTPKFWQIGFSLAVLLPSIGVTALPGRSYRGRVSTGWNFNWTCEQIKLR